jgi:hypothetical protein
MFGNKTRALNSISYNIESLSTRTREANNLSKERNELEYAKFAYTKQRDKEREKGLTNFEEDVRLCLLNRVAGKYKLSKYNFNKPIITVDKTPLKEKGFTSAKIFERGSTLTSKDLEVYFNDNHKYGFVGKVEGDLNKYLKSMVTDLVIEIDETSSMLNDSDIFNEED